VLILLGNRIDYMGAGKRITRALMKPGKRGIDVRASSVLLVKVGIATGLAKRLAGAVHASATHGGGRPVSGREDIARVVLAARRISDCRPKGSAHVYRNSIRRSKQSTTESIGTSSIPSYLVRHASSSAFSTSETRERKRETVLRDWTESVLPSQAASA
jgi:hypothetical protein